MWKRNVEGPLAVLLLDLLKASLDKCFCRHVSLSYASRSLRFGRKRVNQQYLDQGVL
jgi:hypothetical protein